MISSVSFSETEASTKIGILNTYKIIEMLKTIINYCLSFFIPFYFFCFLFLGHNQFTKPYSLLGLFSMATSLAGSLLFTDPKEAASMKIGAGI